MKPLVALAAILSAGLLLNAQTTTPARRLVRATGEATVSATPDQARLNVGVQTQAESAEQAAAQNAAQVDAVLARLRSVLGSLGEIRTISYSISPLYRYPSGQPPILTGYTASNTVEVTTRDLSIIGRLIDAASQAGANQVHGLRFGLRNPEPLRAQALSAAAKQARAHAEAIASGLGARLGTVITAQEGSAVVIRSPEMTTADTRVTTPIETGTVDIQATVTVEAEMI